MISASEAKRMAEDVSSNELKIQLEKIEAAIKAAANRGSYSCYIDRPHENVRKRLETLGYTVETTYDQRDGDFHTVSW